MTNRVMFIKGGHDVAAELGKIQIQLLQLPNPSTGQQQQYLLSSTAGLLEMNRVKHATSSWLIDDSFCSALDLKRCVSGRLLVSFGALACATTLSETASPQHTSDQRAHRGLCSLSKRRSVSYDVAQQPPYYNWSFAVHVGASGLKLTAARQPAGMFQELESLLCSQQWPDAQQLLPLAQQHLPSVCDVKLVADTNYYKLNPHKALAFLRLCVQQTLAALRSHSPSSIAGLPDPEQQAYAVRFLREYINQSWFDKLAGSYSLSQHSSSTQDTTCPAQRPASGNTNTEKKPKLLDPKEVARKKAEESRAAAAAAKMQKQAAGSKKISQFFQAAKKAK